MTPEAAHPLRDNTHLHRVMIGTNTKKAVAEEAVAHTTGAVIPEEVPTTLPGVGMISHAVATRIGMLEAVIVIREEGEEMSQEAPWIEGHHMRTAIGTTSLGGQETTVRMPIVGLNTRGRDMMTRIEPITGTEGSTEIEAQTTVSKTHTQGP
jgi:hypothetical protein